MPCFGPRDRNSGRVHQDDDADFAGAFCYFGVLGLTIREEVT
jgi:hypothetical protein